MTYYYSNNPDHYFKNRKQEIRLSAEMTKSSQHLAPKDVLAHAVNTKKDIVCLCFNDNGILVQQEYYSHARNQAYRRCADKKVK